MDVYNLTVRQSFAAAHRLREYEGNCERLHGHNWQVEATVESERLDDRGMAMDFRAIKVALNDILSGMDHKYLNEIPPFDARNPSSENLARYIFEKMEGKVPSPARLRRITVWESDDCCAEYTRRG
ncbi:MAG TPA: 6-carboxytetrahydropterin synthase QueD [Candidatus Limnocylindrales bacterium]|nr:6-carboxytetrahydropterin synthase QueD [Candidatus Limnocylindrales bacterium]